MRIIMLVLVVICLVSCQSKRDVKARVRHTWISKLTYVRIYENVIQIESVDSAFKKGDIIELGSNEYIIDSMMK